jgi:pimeloyl-ACP methyl ester carboxylesterase
MAAVRILKRLAAAIFFSGAVAVATAQQLDAAAPSLKPMPGFRDGDAGARQLRYLCAGEGAPTVLIEAGGDTSFETLHSWVKQHNFSPPWLAVVSGIQKAARVCVYDRAGVGRSGKAPLPRTSADVATDLRALLRNEKIAIPIVCVGHSFGGSNCRIFASRFPKLVAGMVLIDTSDADFWPRMQEHVPTPAANESEDIKRLRSGPDLTKAVEWIDLEANSALLRNAKGIGDKPLIVLTASPEATDPMIPPAQQPDASRVHQELQRELLDLSTSSRQVIATRAGHNIQREEPQLIVDAVLEVINQVRDRSGASASKR